MTAPDDSSFFPKLPTEEREKALADPGPSWKQYFYRDFLKWWTVLGFLVVDVWIFGGWFEVGLVWAIPPSLAGALYLEYLGYQALWYDPGHGAPSETDRSRWIHPVPFGRWTRAGERVRQGLSPISGEAYPEGPDPAEFR